MYIRTRTIESNVLLFHYVPVQITMFHSRTCRIYIHILILIAVLNTSDKIYAPGQNRRNSRSRVARTSLVGELLHSVSRLVSWVVFGVDVYEL
jgi:hypothetical protein